MWEVWKWNGRYIKGKFLKKYKTKESAVNYAKKTIKYKRISKGQSRGEFFLEDEEGQPLGMIIKTGNKND